MKLCRILICVVSFFIFGCAEMPQEVILKPDVDSYDSSVSVSIAKMDNAKYLNIFRAEWDESNQSVIKDSIYNICQVTPKDDILTSYNYSDEKLVKNKYYVYKIRYWNGTNYNYTSWSDPVKVSNSNFELNEDLMYKVPEDLFYLYDEDTCTIELSDFKTETNIELTLMDHFTPYKAEEGVGFKPALVFSYGEGENEVTKIFTTSVEIELVEGHKIPLRSILTEDFFDKKIKLKYIVAQETSDKEKYKSETSEDEKEVYYTRFIWSYPKEIGLKNVDGKELETIEIKNSTAEEGGDYSQTGITTGNSATVTKSIRSVEYPVDNSI